VKLPSSLRGLTPSLYWVEEIISDHSNASLELIREAANFPGKSEPYAESGDWAS
jgi:hypothetical protein